MAKHFMILALCVESGLLVGGGVAVGQLWYRSELAEQRETELRQDLKTAQTEVETVDAARQQREDETRRLASALQEEEERATRFQSLITSLEERNKQLFARAEESDTLSEKIAELEKQLATPRASAKPAADESDTAGDARDELVRVRPATPAPNQSATAVPVSEPVRFDDTGWTSVTVGPPVPITVGTAPPPAPVYWPAYPGHTIIITE